jgi:hypothetical protein
LARKTRHHSPIWKKAAKERFTTVWVIAAGINRPEQTANSVPQIMEHIKTLKLPSIEIKIQASDLLRSANAIEPSVTPK